MARHKVGDKVKIRSHKSIEKEFVRDCDGFRGPCGVYFVSGMDKYCGKTVTIARIHSAGYRIKEDCEAWNWTDDMFEANTIIIYTDGNKVVALDKATGKTGTAYCSPEDEFNFFAGADIAYNRLRGRLKPARKHEVAKYYNGEVVCTKTEVHHLTKGKIYKVKNGKFTDDCGIVHGDIHPYVSFEDLNTSHFSEFIEVIR